MLPVAAWADCADSSWSFFPPAGTAVPINTRLVIDGYGDAQAVAGKLGEHHPILEGGGQSIPLEVKEVNVGQKSITQVVLVPEHRLKPKTRYVLKVTTTGDEPAVTLRDGMKPAWTTSDTIDLDAPSFKAPPLALAGIEKQFGCGPQIEALVAVQIEDTGPVLLLATVTGSLGQPRRYLVPARDGQVHVGHGMCLGAFRLDEGRWSLELTAVDAAGNQTPAPGGPMRFKGISPTP